MDNFERWIHFYDLMGRSFTGISNKLSRWIWNRLTFLCWKCGFKTVKKSLFVHTQRAFDVDKALTNGGIAVDISTVFLRCWKHVEKALKNQRRNIDVEPMSKYRLCPLGRVYNLTVAAASGWVGTAHSDIDRCYLIYLIISRLLRSVVRISITRQGIRVAIVWLSMR